MRIISRIIILINIRHGHIIIICSINENEYSHDY